MPPAAETSVISHYGTPGLVERVIRAVDEACGAGPIDPKALSAIDEFHVGGRAATAYVIATLGLTPDMAVLDIGCGLGGVARYLAKACGCRVAGIDLTPEYIEIARALNERTGLADRMEMVTGSALDLPWPDRHFDAAVTFHVAMNIEDRDRMYAEAYRVLKPGGVLAVYDITKGPTEGLRYPVPWAETAATSFLVTPTETRRLVEAAGFQIVTEEDRRAVAMEHHRSRVAALSTAGPPVLGMHLLQGTTMKQKSQNMIAMLEGGQITITLLVGRRV